MKLTDANFQLAVKAGGLALLLSTIGNLYLLLRYREVYRDASRIELTVQQAAMRQQLLDSLIREFATRAQTDPGVAEIFRRNTQSAKP